MNQFTFKHYHSESKYFENETDDAADDTDADYEFALACHFNFSALCAFVILNSFAFNDATVAFNVFIVSSNFAILISC